MAVRPAPAIIDWMNETGYREIVRMVSENLEKIRGNIEKAAIRSGRRGDDITLVAVTKNFGVDYVRAAVECGVRVVGESRVQEAMKKHDDVGDAVEWHMIGHLQKNKVKYAFDVFSLIHSVDSVELASELSRRAVARGMKDGMGILLQVNVAGEESKHGVRPEDAARAAEELSRLPGVRLKGLMAIPPYSDDPEDSRPYFRRMLEIRREIEGMDMTNAGMEILSFGMSGDYEVAIEEGATHVRIGSAIFGDRYA